MRDEKVVRFDALDGLRGIAAVAVMIYHYSQHNGLNWLSGAWAAVDLFFILSGFVIAHSYGTKISAGMRLREFVLVRFIRLGPLYFLGLVIGISAVALQINKGQTAGITYPQLFQASAFGLAWLPYFQQLNWPIGDTSVGGAVFPLNDPAWSLFFEVFVNIIFFLFVTRFRRVASGGVVFVALSIYIFSAMEFEQISPGWNASSFPYAFPRVIAEFFLGALIYQMGFHMRPQTKGGALLVSLLAFSGFFIGGGRSALLNSLTLIPLTVALASAVRMKGALQSACKMLGNLSYPVYVIHFPVYRLALELFDLKVAGPATQTLLLASLTIVVAVPLVYLDEKFRRLLMIRLVKERHSQPARVRQLDA